MPTRTKAPLRRLNHVPKRPGAPRPRRSAAELAALKSRTRRDYCRKVGHWRQECPTRRHSLTDTVRAKVPDKRHNNTGLAEVLFEVSNAKDAQNDCRTAVEDQNSPSSVSHGDGHTVGHGVAETPTFTDVYHEEDEQADAVSVFDSSFTKKIQLMTLLEYPLVLRSRTVPKSNRL